MSFIRGGVLEPEGIVEIKFRAKDLLKVMHRIDPMMISMKAEMQSANLPQEQRLQLEQKIVDREKFLMPMYHQVAVHFADLHDTPERMKEKGVIMVCRFSLTRAFFFSFYTCNITTHNFYYFSFLPPLLQFPGFSYSSNCHIFLILVLHIPVNFHEVSF
jgi:Acetyl-CoA carboxylase, carboxyltransferase component (subunits alpha and beta)